MTERFTLLDDALIDRLFQPLADWMDRHLALGTNRAARIGIDLACLAWICAQAGAAADALAGHDVPSCFARAVLVVVGLWAFTILRNVFQRPDRDARARIRAQANPLRPGMQLHRAACLFWMIGLAVKSIMAPSGFGSLALLAVGVFATAAVYIGACTNHPPKWRAQHQPGRDMAFGFGSSSFPLAAGADPVPQA